MSDWNIGPTALILGAVYLNLTLHLNFWVAVIFVAIGLSQLGWLTYGDEKSAIWKAKARIMEAKATYWEKKAQGASS